ncbi:hypothetical protein PF005_g21656 [Phytophthora fragariae]|uniref:Uncharacterized protein n=1 Tax=Phytophthora fragariae TaxID=53985 RepID=A0A6A3WG04_9STRA|nr:hypothetical protein PF003_g33320 [Phytophthora fragariae]KAE8928711.1 hypothetical protein PF009_g21154 [Phytophthora fragariae]KAE8986319.1 hypothetical protein PF011_g20034 [Phytophthora fragariae]KAE9085040.1 hypothetical protein PF007_g21288 [Phytophthora fragariae]KAE9085580.1 hypothetical protein PF010_g20405 [Phytophthora fragariae]
MMWVCFANGALVQHPPCSRGGVTPIKDSLFGLCNRNLRQCPSSNHFALDL